jgi:predicted DNA-binding transcriptional regulator YafY
MEAFVRMLDLVALLQGDMLTGETLAARLGVTLRTLRRDIGRLREAGFAVEATLGVYGGYRLASGSRLPPLVVSDDEALALTVALGGPSTATVEELAGVASKDLLAKLERLMPAALQQQVAALREVTVSSLRSPPAPASVAALVPLARSCRECRVVEFDYSASGSHEPSRKRVEPYRLVQTSHCWYLVARDREKAEWRTYRVDRMTEPTVTPSTFTRIDPPNAERLVTEGIAVAVYAQRAVLEIPASADDVLRAVPRSYGLVEPIDGSRCRVTVGFDDERWLVQLIANLPWDVAVVEPQWVRESVAALGRRLVAAHADDPLPTAG